MKGAFTILSSLFRPGCIWLLVVSFLGCSVARLAAEELKLYGDKPWMGQVIITEDRWFNEPPDPVENEHFYKVHTEDGHRPINLLIPHGQ